MTDTQPTNESSTESASSSSRLTRLREILVRRFSVDELRTLCFDLGLEYGELPGEGKEGKVRELVAFLGRRDRIPELEEKARRLRPDAFEEPRPAEKAPGRTAHLTSRTRAACATRNHQPA